MTCCVQWSVHPCVQASIGGQRMNLYQVTFTFYPEQNILTSSKLATCPRTQAESVLIVHGVFQDWRCWSNCSDRISGRRLGLIFSWMQRRQWPEGIRLRLLTMCKYSLYIVHVQTTENSGNQDQQSHDQSAIHLHATDSLNDKSLMVMVSSRFIWDPGRTQGHLVTKTFVALPK